MKFFNCPGKNYILSEFKKIPGGKYQVEDYYSSYNYILYEVLFGQFMNAWLILLHYLFMLVFILSA